MSDLLEDGSYMFISAPVVDKMMRDGFTNAMNFEHTYGLTKNLLYKILSHAKLKIIDEQDYSEYCVFIVAQKDAQTSDTPEFDNVEDSSYFHDFIFDRQTETGRIKGSLTEKRENTFIFGAHIFTQFLLKFGLNESSFSFILDNDLDKQGCRLYGTNLVVKSPKILKDIESPLVVLKAAQYTEEIKADILENINPNTRFIL